MPKPKKLSKATASNSHLWEGKTPANSPVVGIHWRDIADIDNWNDEDGEVAPARTYSVGHLLYQGPDPSHAAQDMTVIAVAYDTETERWASFTVFPSMVIWKIEPISPKRRGK